MKGEYEYNCEIYRRYTYQNMYIDLTQNYNVEVYEV